MIAAFMSDIELLRLARRRIQPLTTMKDELRGLAIGAISKTGY